MDKLSPVDRFKTFWAKREDLVAWERPDWPSGSKVRQYNKMCAASPDVPVLVGCSAWSLQQVYCAAAGKKFKRQVIIYLPRNAKRSDATEYCLRMNAEVVELPPPCFPSTYRKRARDRTKKIGGCVRWDAAMAMQDTMFQTQNLPKKGIRRIIVPTGSGLTAIGILAGCVKFGINAEVVAYCWSTLANKEKIISSAMKLAGGPLANFSDVTLPKFRLVRVNAPYKSYKVAQLPDGTPLDPFYSAKVFEFIGKEDLVWLTGLRPVCSMPEDCRKQFKSWKGR